MGQGALPIWTRKKPGSLCVCVCVCDIQYHDRRQGFCVQKRLSGGTGLLICACWYPEVVWCTGSCCYKACLWDYMFSSKGDQMIWYSFDARGL